MSENIYAKKKTNNFKSCFCVRDSANTPISKLSGAWKESRTVRGGSTAPNAGLIPLKKEDTVCCFTLLPGIRKHLSPAEPRLVLTGGGLAEWDLEGVEFRGGPPSLIGLGESWDCGWREAVGWIGAWPVVERSTRHFRPNRVGNEWRGKSAVKVSSSGAKCCFLVLQQQ